MTTIVVGAPRSGASLLVEALTSDPAWSRSALSREHVIDDLVGHDSGPDSHRLVPSDLTSELRDALRSRAQRPADGGQSVAWNPRLSLRVALLAEALPEARFILMARRPVPTISSLMDAWHSRRFVSVPDLPGWWGDPWSFPLVPGWRDLIGRPPAEVCAAQWGAITTAVLDDLQALSDDRWTVASYEALVEDPRAEAVRVTSSLGLPWAADLSAPLPVTASAVTPPAPGKWQRHHSEIAVALPRIQEVVIRLRDTATARWPQLPWRDLEQPSKPEPAVRTIASEGTPFSSEHTASMARLLEQSRASLVISTYKSGHVILARHDGGKVNTEFTNVSRPMGVAVAGSRLAVGALDSILSFTANPGVAARVPSTRPVDLAYAPRSIVFTGDVQIHDMGYGADGVLYFVNTRFSCLCRQDIDHSFEPIWRPAWITALAAEDRCHLNGLALVDGVPRYVTALSQTDTAGGWRELKGTSGVIIDITDDRVVTSGLSMPHSPRWHDGRLWVLESGKGTLSTVDPSTGALTSVATLPGFTRGLSFVGPYALVGLSQVRESVFSSLPITEQAAERNCGVWCVDTRSGSVVGFLRFSGVVQEIFDVHVLPGAWPVILDAGDLTVNAFVLSDAALRQLAPAETDGD